MCGHRLAASAVALAEAQQASDNLQQECSSQASRAAAGMQRLQAEVAQLQQENVQLVMKAAAQSPLKLGVQVGEHEHPRSPSIMAAMQPAGMAGSDTGTDAGCKVRVWDNLEAHMHCQLYVSAPLKGSVCCT
jgi:hypothetical protein